ncbi:hypothetical protein HZS_2074 [Henneguya salminicola]|nr:hypothetical protein HZS_2074 [Henneguya salminicola]
MNSESRIVMIALDTDNETSHLILKDYAENYQKENDQIIIVSIYNYGNIDTPIMYSAEEPTVCVAMWKKAVKEVRESILSNLNDARKYLTSYNISNSKIDTYLKESTDGVGEVICNVAEELSVDFVMMGKHNRSAMNRILIGSVSTYVIHHNKKPTILVTLKS